MKKLMFIIAVLLILSLAGCRTLGESNFSSYEYEEYKVIVKDSASQLYSVAEENKSEILSQINEITSSSAEETEKDESISNEPDKTKTITINGKVYTVPFVKTAEKGFYIDCDRKTNIYYNESRSIRLEYDYATDALLHLIVDIENSQTKITEDEARKIAEDFIKTQCDITPYTFAEITADEKDGYFVIFSRYIQGYYSAQLIDVNVTFDGNIRTYSHNKFEFDGINTDIKIDKNQLDEKLKDNLQKIYGDNVKYTMSDSVTLDVDDDGKLGMHYAVDVLEINAETGEEQYDYLSAFIPIEGDNVKLTRYEEM